MKKKKILVTGASGQLGSEIRLLADQYFNFDFTYVDVADLDLTNDVAVKKYFSIHQFDFIINCSAYTAVDKAETEPELAKKVNEIAVKLLAEIATEKKSRLIHVSTDYVFDGKSYTPFNEESKPNPLSVYGKTKYEGELHVLRIATDAYIFRTAWVYSTFGKNFVKTITNLARERAELGIVADQIGTPTYAGDLANCILSIIRGIVEKNHDRPGIYHYTNEGVTSWYDFAYFINQHYKFNCQIKAIRTEEYKTVAVRPAFSVLDKSKIKRTFGVQIPHWSDSLQKCLSKMTP